MPRQSAAPLQVHQPIPQLMMDLGPPLFQLKGLAIGNGLTDPQLQVSANSTMRCDLFLTVRLLDQGLFLETSVHSC